MPIIEANGIRIAYESAGAADASPLLMIHGLGAQLVRWPQAFCSALVEAGFRIIRFDNRDVGLSSHLPDDVVPDFAAIEAAIRAGRKPNAPYDLSDMAADAFGLLDALGIGSAHVLGVSLGGMIAQVMAIERPERVRSLAIVMSGTGNPDLPPDPDAVAILARPAADPRTDREGYIAHQIALNRALGSTAGSEELRAYAETAAARAYNPLGPARQLAASKASPDRREALRCLAVPAVVIHGVEDRLVPVANGEDIAAHITGSWFLKIKGMGHDLPLHAFGGITGIIGANAARC